MLCTFVKCKGVSGATSIAFQASNQFADSNTWTIPTVIAGDLIILVDHENSGGGSPAAVTPTGAGFTNAMNYNDATLFSRYMVHYKIASGSESGTSVTGMAGDTNDANFCRKFVWTFRPNVAATLVTPSTAVTVTSDANPAAVTVLSGAGVVPLVVIGGWGGGISNPISPRSASPAMDAELGLSGAWSAYKVYNSAPSNIALDMDDEGIRNTVYGLMFQVS